MAEITITKANFEQEVLKSDKPVLADFWAPWCGPCRMLSPVISEIALEREDIKVCKVNVDDLPELAIKYHVSAVPTLLIFEDGDVAETIVGFRSKEDILEML